MGKIRIDGKTGFAYIPKELREDGFVGDAELLLNALTLVLIKPGVSLERARESLKVILKDIELRLKEKGERAS